MIKMYISITNKVLILDNTVLLYNIAELYLYVLIFIKYE